MRLSTVLISTSIIVILGGIWVAIVPFVGPYVMGTAMAMRSMGPAVTASTYVYHIVPGTIVGLVGIFQLVAGLQRTGRPASTTTTEQSIQHAQDPATVLRAAYLTMVGQCLVHHYLIGKSQTALVVAWKSQELPGYISLINSTLIDPQEAHLKDAHRAYALDHLPDIKTALHKNSQRTSINLAPHPAIMEEQMASRPDIQVCAVKLSINDALAVCIIQTSEGTTLATRFWGLSVE